MSAGSKRRDDDDLVVKLLSFISSPSRYWPYLTTAPINLELLLSTLCRPSAPSVSALRSPAE